VDTGDTEPEQESVQLSTVFLFMNTSSGYSEEEGGGVFRVGWRCQLLQSFLLFMNTSSGNM
jgi:hypothetical protein